MQKSLHELIASTSELRSLPSTTLQLTALLDDDTVDAGSVLAIIGKDPSLTSNLLKLANSAFYGLRRQVGTTREALVMLGNQTVVNLAFAASMGDVLRGPLAAYRLGRNEMWHHALGCALASSTLIVLDQGGVESRERAFTCGLVHDIGKLIMNRPLQKELVQLPVEGTFNSLMTAEKQVLGFDHSEAGAALGESWNFPTYLVNVIRFHHRPDEATEDPEMTRAVAAANLLVCQVGFAGGTGLLPEETFWEEMNNLGYTPEEITPVMEKLPLDLENMLAMIGQSP